MKITQEADYAIRICSVLDSLGGKCGAATIAANAGITPTIALKTLRRLSKSGYVKSYKGVSGGYELARPSGEITVLELVQLIDGEMHISKCLGCDYDCTRNPCKTNCKMHIAFGVINKQITENLGKITINMLNDETVTAHDITDIINKNNSQQQGD